MTAMRAGAIMAVILFCTVLIGLRHECRVTTIPLGVTVFWASEIGVVFVDQAKDGYRGTAFGLWLKSMAVWFGRRSKWDHRLETVVVQVQQRSSSVTSVPIVVRDPKLIDGAIVGYAGPDRRPWQWNARQQRLEPASDEASEKLGRYQPVEIRDAHGWNKSKDLVVLQQGVPLLDGSLLTVERGSRKVRVYVSRPTEGDSVLYVVSGDTAGVDCAAYDNVMDF